MTNTDKDKLYIVLISVHGLIRGHDLELGRDADTGGQVLYVLELARALAQHPDVGRVDLMTRQVIDNKVAGDYAEPVEPIADNAFIIRIPFGPRRYLRKEVLWPHLDNFIDNALLHIRSIGRSPDLIHSHYADAGYAGARLAQLLGTPLFHTGHSLGRIKLQRLQEKGVKPDIIESRYNISQRIEAEEIALGNAARVVTSTRQEIEQQYKQYENYHPQRDIVIPPGVDLKRFHPPRRGEVDGPIAEQVNRFLNDPKKPIILALSRPDERKNIANLVRAYGEHQALQKLANLVIIAGNRDDIRSMDKGAAHVLTELLYLIDYYDLYGRVAIPKHHEAHDVPDLYRMAARSKGLFINPALTEPFGLTLIEAAASGIPIIATEDGGPIDIIGHCQNGVLIDPLDSEAIGDALYDALRNKKRWNTWSKNGIKGAHAHYTWQGHVNKYVDEIKKVIGKKHPRRPIRSGQSRMPGIDRLLVCDIDNTLLGDRASLRELLRDLREHHDIGFCVATGRRIDSAVEILEEWSVPMPDLLITAVGTEIYYGHGMIEDLGWYKHIDYRWDKADILKAMASLPGLKMQAKTEQRRFKISYNMDVDKAPTISEIRKHLRKKDLHVKLVYSHDVYLDILPIRASKGLALRYLGMKWAIDQDHMLAAGDSGNDEEMLAGNTLGVIVGNYSPELKRLEGRPRIYVSRAHYAAGVREGIEYYDFFGDIRVPNDES